MLGHWYLTWENLMLPRSRGQDPDTSTYMYSLSSSNISCVMRSKGNRNILKWLFCWASEIGILMMLQVKPIWSTMGIIISMEIWTRYYRYLLIVRKILFGRAIYMPYEITLCSQILDPWSWYSRVNGFPISWRLGWIIKIYGW